ncbi:MAG TPA: YdeI/OmpD-associated family protein [Bacteroidales bacterium]|nr:YdeI/OmpD-associated family protein [Bacteroidales bacterium]
MKKYGTAEEFILGNEHWQDSLILLRDLLLSTGMEETIKWGGPVYTYNGKNIAGMAGFKSYVGIWFFQGALLKDEGKKLIAADEDYTRALRQWRFNSLDEIADNALEIVSYVKEAIQNVRAGKEIKPRKNRPLIIPEELEQKFNSNADLRASFEKLSLTQKREYVAYIGNAKRAETRQSRLEKSIPLILQGIGIMDRYR